MSLLISEGQNYFGEASSSVRARSALVLTDAPSQRQSVGSQRRSSDERLLQAIARGLVKGFHTKQSLLDFITCVASAADQALVTRQYDTIGALSQLLLSLPLSHQLESIGHFYEALSINRCGLGDTVRANALFEQVADRGPLNYRARAMLLFAARAVSGGNYPAALSWYSEIMRMSVHHRAVEPATSYSVRLLAAIVKAWNGDHRGALADLEEIYPLARLAIRQDPRIYYLHLNSLAVELGEVGRLEEAARASEIALSSPFAPWYPEYQETFDDIAVKQLRASRSIVAVSGFAAPPNQVLNPAPETQVARRHIEKTDKLVSISTRQPALFGAPEHVRSEDSPARILDFQQWKRRSQPTSTHLNALSREQKEEMTIGEKLIRLMDLISDDETDDETIDVILEAVEAIVIGRKGAS